MKRNLWLWLVIVLTSGNSYAQLNFALFANGLTAPVDIKNCGDGRLFVVEQDGHIQLFDLAGNRFTRPFLNISSRVYYGGERGLLGLAFPSDYKTSGYFYVNYTSNPNGATTISRFRVSSNPDSAIASSEEILLSIYQPYSNHNGGHLAFNADGYLYIGTGDGGSQNDPQNRAQNTDSLLGKILRIEVDPSYSGYRIPPGNPFAGNPSLGRPEIWSIGMRNPWRWSFDPLTHDMWIGDVGQNTIEEIDFQPYGSPGGLNYGWRCYEGNQTFNTAGCLAASEYVSPIFSYTHSSGRCSITGGYVYRGAQYGDLYGKYFYTDYCSPDFHSITRLSNGTFQDTDYGTFTGVSGIVAFGVDSSGNLYCSSGSGGQVFHIESTVCRPVAMINDGRDTLDDCGTGSVHLQIPFYPGNVYAWTLNGNTIFNDTNAVTATQPGTYMVNVIDQNNCRNSDTVVVSLTTPLNLSFTGVDTIVCIYDASSNLSPNILGGKFSGPGIRNATFTPSTAGFGLHQIIYTYRNPSGCTYSYSQNVRVDACLGLEENSWTSTLNIYPNPSQNDFSIRGYSVAHKELKVEIVTLTGQIVYTELHSSDGLLELPVEHHLPSGLYFVQLSDGKNSSVKKLIIN